MGNAVMCDCFVCRSINPRGPRAKDDGTTGEHLCEPCLRTPECRDHPRNNPAEDLPEEDEVKYVRSGTNG